MKKEKRFTKHQLGAFITLLLVAAWGIWVLLYHFTRPMGMEWIEILFLSVLIPAYVILLPLYLFRVRWSYIGGVIALLGLVIGALKSIFDKTFFFSFSIYNLTTVAVYIALIICIYFSVKSFISHTVTKKIWNVAGIVLLVAAPAIAVSYVTRNRQDIENYQLKRIIQSVVSRTQDAENLEQKLEVLMAEGHIPSIATAIVVNDQIVWVKSFGESEAVNKQFDMGSIGKSVTATALLQLYEQGLVDLDDDVNTYLPFSVRHPQYPNIPITLRMLLSHQSCLGHNTEYYYAYMMGTDLLKWGGKQRGWKTLDEFETLTFGDFISRYLQPGGPYYSPENWAPCKPGASYSYSTPGFDILGYVVEQVSGMTFNDYLKSHVFDPLQMTNTTSTPLDTPELIATPYERWYGVLLKSNVELPLSQRQRVGGGGIYTSVSDLAKFILMHMNEGRINDIQLLKPESITEMHQSAVEATGDFMQTGYGYGWGRFQVAPRQMWDITYQPRGYQGHGGRYWGYSSALYMVDTQQGAYGFVMLMNLSMVEAMESPWLLAVQMNIQDHLLQEAYALYQSTINDN